jgi:hypothetical protein
MEEREKLPTIWKRPLIFQGWVPLLVDIMIGKFPILQYILPES